MRSSDAVERVLGRLEGVKRRASGWTARCPAHHDRHASLSVSCGEDGRALLKCFAGCGAGDVVAALGLDVRDLFVPPQQERGIQANRWGVTVAQLARYKRLPANLLREFGVTDAGGAVRIAYRLMDGRQAPVTRTRTALCAKEGSRWAKDDRPIPYGLWRLEDARTAGYLILVEGESDCWTLWHHGLPALGLPGADMARKLERKHLLGIPRLFVIREPDRGGTTFTTGVARRLVELNWTGEACVVALEGVKDPSELHQQNPDGFEKAFQAALAAAEPLAAAGDAWLSGEGAAESVAEEDEPIPLFVESGDVKPFPTDVLPLPFRRLVTEGSKAIHCPPDFLGVPLLALAGVAIGTSRVLQVKASWLEGPRIWTALVADPGSKKSPALDLVMYAFRARQEQLHAVYRAEKRAHQTKQAEYEVACAGWKRSIKGGDAQAHPRPEPPEPPLMEQVFTTDATVEALADLLAQNPRGLLLCRDELAGWALSMDQYKGGKGSDRQIWLSFWSGAQALVNRRSRQEPLVLGNPFIGVVGALPPDVLGDLSDERGREDGFIHRVLFAFPDRLPGQWTEDEVDAETLQAAGAVFERLWVLRPALDALGTLKPAVATFTPRGKVAWVDWINEHYKEQEDPAFPENLRGPWSKLEGYCARLALILQECRYACGEAEDEAVDELSVVGAAALIDYFKSHARRVCARLQATPEDKQVAGAVAWVRRQGGQVTAREVLRNHMGGVRTSQDAMDLLRKLEQRGCGTVEEVTSARGRKGVRFTLAHHATRDNNQPAQIRSAS